MSSGQGELETTDVLVPLVQVSLVLCDGEMWCRCAGRQDLLEVESPLCRTIAPNVLQCQG